MGTIFMTSENIETYDHHGLLLNLLDKMNLKKRINLLLYQILASAVHGKI